MGSNGNGVFRSTNNSTFNTITNIKFRILKAGMTKLAVIDMSGNEIEILVNEWLTPGTYEIPFDAAEFKSGVYHYKLTTSKYTEIKKLLIR
jgi:hypothetical protein